MAVGCTRQWRIGGRWGEINQYRTYLGVSPVRIVLSVRSVPGRSCQLLNLFSALKVFTVTQDFRAFNSVLKQKEDSGEHGEPCTGTFLNLFYWLDQNTERWRTTVHHCCTVV